MTDTLVQGALFTVMVLRVGEAAGPALETSLREQIARSPQFFANAPIVVDLKDSVGFEADGDFAALKQLLQGLGLVPVGVQNAAPAQQQAAQRVGLGTLSAPAGARKPAAQAVTASAAAPGAAHGANGSATKSILVTEPVRSGKQIYAPGGDVIVLRSVSAGAEIIADGHIHVYGALRGRAIAGAKGDASARIFAGRLEAELVSIAGRYLVREDIPPAQVGQRVQVMLQEKQVVIIGQE